MNKINKDTDMEGECVAEGVGSSLGRIDTMIYEYNNSRRENDRILLLKVRRTSKLSSKERLSHSSSLSTGVKKNNR